MSAPTTISVTGSPVAPAVATNVYISQIGANSLLQLDIGLGQSTAQQPQFQLYVPLTGTAGSSELLLQSASAAFSPLAGQAVTESSSTIATTAVTGLQLWTISGTATAPAILAGNLQGPWTISDSVTYYVPMPFNLPTAVNYNSFSNALKGAVVAITSTSSSSSTTTSSISNAAASSVLGSPARISASESFSSSSKITDPVSSISQSPASSSSPAQNGTIGESSNGSAAGAIAGGTIGGILGGLLLGALIAWCVFKRRQRSRESSLASSRWRDEKATSITPIAAATGAGVGAALTSWRKHLPQGKAEKELAQEFNSIFGLIKIHVESFYGPTRGHATPEQMSRLRSVVDSDMIRLLGTTTEIGTVLQRIIAGFLVARISLRSDPAESFLPASYLNVPSMIRVNLEDAKVGGRPSTSSKDLLPAFADWRVLTNFLTSNADSRATDNELRGRIDHASRVLSQALSGFEKNQRDASNQDRGLRQIMDRMAAAGIDVFMQPATFNFQWSDQRQFVGQSIVVYPAIIKILDESGKRLNRAEFIVPAQIGQI